MGTIASMICLAMLSAGASELPPDKDHRKQVLDNVGFMKNPPTELKERFSMCDAFLKVNWIDKQKKIGYSRYDLYKNGKKNGQMKALIYLNQYYPHFDYDLNQYVLAGKLDAVFSLVRDGEIVGNEALLTIRQGDTRITFWPTLPSLPTQATFLDNNQNICIPYPDNQRVWIAEGRKVGKTFDEEQIQEKYELMKKSFPGLKISQFREMNVTDLNHDGLDDYYRNDGWVSYSYDNRYHQMMKTEAGLGYTRWYFPSSKQTCELRPSGFYYLVTDGRDYFFSDQCNLTDLVNRGE